MSVRKAVPIERADWRIAPVPEWVEAREPDWAFAPPDGHAVAFLLLDEQDDVATQACHSRTVRRLLTPGAVQALAQVEIDFDPAAHRLLIHELAVWRVGADGRFEKRSLARSDAFLLRQREQQLEQQILSGRVSVVALLEDVRVGDAIEVAWTIEPLDPLPGLRFTAFFAFVWSLPVARAAFGLRLSAEHPVRWRMHAPTGVVPPAVEAGPQRATWRLERPPISTPEPNAPAGDWPFAVLDVSGWESWREVARFMAELWTEAMAEGAEVVGAEAARLRSGRAGPEAVREAIRFVQEEIRHLAVDFGHGAGLLPNGAGTVLRRRFGDCKDKAVLLTALLRRLGVEAWPLLVGAGWREAVARVQPSTAAFSHAIVTFFVEGQRRFVDPTLVGQGGDLQRLIAPPFGCGLEVRADAEDLLPLPELPAAELTLTETFHLDRKQREGAVEQVLRASAWLADELRAGLVRQGRAAFFRAQGEALQRHFPALRPGDATAAVEDDADANVIELRARHGLPTWGASGEKPPAMFSYGAHGLFLAMERVEGPERRRQSWAQRFPMTVHHRVVVRGRCVRKARPELHQFSGPGFRYRCEVSARSREVAFDYRWESTRREVAPDDWPEYCRQRGRALERTGANVATTASRASTQWGAFAVTIVLLVAAMRLLVPQADRGSRAPAPPAPSTAERQQAERDLRAAWEAAQRGEYAAAEPLLERAREGYAGSFEFHTLRAEVAVHTGRLDRAREALAAARGLNPRSHVPDLVEAALHEALGELAAARKLLERALAQAPDDPRALFNLARITERSGDHAAARAAWEKVLARQPAQPDALFHHAFLLWRGGERERADAVITGAIRAQPAPSAWLETALVQYYAATGRHREAVAPARRATELAPDQAFTAAQYATVLARAGDLGLALEVAQRAATEFPEYPGAWGALATVAATAGDVETAERAFGSWLQRAPADADAHANYGLFLSRTDRAVEGRAVLEEATRRFPGHGAVWMNYAVVLEALGESRAASEARRKADALFPQEQRAALLR
jgi:tetratricopeptide (TPR) repeat protein